MAELRARSLQPAVKAGIFDVWVDRRMKGGADWDPDIETKLRACDIFVLLVSPHAMASDYIIDKEIAIIRERQANGEPVGRAHLAFALSFVAPQAREDAYAAQVQLGDAVQGLRAAGRLDAAPRGLLARAVFRRSVGDWDGAARDLDEVEEIAGPGPMRLYLCDMALERARLAFARIEAFAPLNGLIDDGPPPPVPPAAGETANLAEGARENLATARGLITRCGYHKRDEELAGLEAVRDGRRPLADLPPRV
jgi:hypothetical protein